MNAIVERITGMVDAPGTTRVFEDEQRQSEVWEVRRSTIEYTRLPGAHSGLAGWEDAAVDPNRLGDYLRDYCDLVRRRDYHTVLFGHLAKAASTLGSTLTCRQRAASTTSPGSLTRQEIWSSATAFSRR